MLMMPFILMGGQDCADGQKCIARYYMRQHNDQLVEYVKRKLNFTGHHRRLPADCYSIFRAIHKCI